jgi:hypothetical protein
MRTNYVLIDYENVQPKDLALLNGHPFMVFVFVGASQNKISTELAEAMQARGENGRYVRISGNGRNALDFHIAFHLGELAAKDPEGFYHVISKDTGFDPLLEHLKARGIRAQRSKGLAEMPILGLSGPKTMDEKLDSIIKNLRSRGSARPRKRKTLASTIHALFSKQLAEGEIETFIDALAERRAISVEDGKVSYNL